MVNATTTSGVTQYGIGKQQAYTQSGPGSANVVFNDFTFEAFINLNSSATLTLAELQGPLLGGTQSLTINSSGGEYHSADFTGTASNAQANLNSHFANSTPGNSGTNYTLSFTTTNPGAAYGVTFSLVGDQYVTAIPEVTINNGGWTNGTYVVAATGEQTMFGWTFGDYNSQTDVILFSIRETNTGNDVVQQQFQGTYTGGFTVAANTLNAGTDYTGTVTFARIVDSDTTTVPGASGYGFYATETSFAIQAVPEPSTYALLGLGALVLVVWQRRISRRRRC